ncbi:unnamed protein product [Phytophthora fragariaefolia]|uniref:RxLR effector protein n=1 Tax=Phytophthora fragariaefolia TaxID=1490495 RepID=A0A9W6YR12_9STRA|nr:unnamed protein product [Phytophthora fragariaefolia]
MRVCVTLVVALVTFVASNGLVLAATNASPVQVAAQQPIKVLRPENNNARNLRERIADDGDGLSSEERGVLDTARKTLSRFTKKGKALELLSTSDKELLKKNVAPVTLQRAFSRLKRSGATDEQIAKFVTKADDYDDYIYRHGNLDPWQ